jgi:hypothetical protein
MMLEIRTLFLKSNSKMRFENKIRILLTPVLSNEKRPPFASSNPMVLAMSISVASEQGSMNSCTCTRIPVDTHSLLPASDSPSASRVDSSIGSAVVVVGGVVLLLMVGAGSPYSPCVTSTEVSKRP